ncbi:MAG: GDP-L-fucose synthase, partial [Pedobacter sp.]
ELDLQDTVKTHAFLKQERPSLVIIAAAKVGGIHANNTYRADFLYENLVIQNNIIWGSHLADVSRLIFLGSSCIYPKNSPQPMPENCLLTGLLETTNQPYAIAKIAGLELVDALRKQYSRDYFSVMPTNLYGPGDNFNLENSHVLPALLKKIIAAKQSNAPAVEVWGTGTPLREFMYSEDCASAIVHTSENCTRDFFDQLHFSHINIGTGQEVSIRELAETIAKEVGYTGKLEFDTSKPDGTPRKLLDTKILKSLNWQPKYSLAEGVRMTIRWYRQTHS